MSAKKQAVPVRIRSRKVELDAAWLEDFKSNYYDPYLQGTSPASGGKKHTLKELGKKMATATKRPKPFAPPILTRFIKGEHAAFATLDAFCQFFGIPLPILTAQTVSEAQWFVAGQELRRIAPDLFGEYMDLVTNQLAAKKTFHKFKQDLSSNPDE